MSVRKSAESGQKVPEKVPEFVARENRRRKLKILRACTACALVLLIALFFALLPYRSMLAPLDIPELNDEMRLHFLSVGQGDCTIVESGGECLVVDGGEGGFLQTNHIIRYIKGLHAEKLSFVITHSSRDHCGGLADVINALGADAVYLPVISSGDESYTDILDEIERQQIPAQKLVRGNEISLPSARVVCLSPEAEGETDKNDSSCVLYLETQAVRILLGADISSVRERALMRLYAENGLAESVELDQIDILKVSHHGSAYSSSEEWLSLLGAQVAVVSCGAGNRYDHPSSEAIERLQAQVGTIYRTDELGDIMITVAENYFHVQTDVTE